MKDEIKEILRILKARSTRYEYCLKENISYSDESYNAHLLYNYITNLQKIIKQRDKDIETLLKTVKVSEKEINKLTAESTEWESKCYELEERIEYLERSNNRREDEIMSLRDECVEGEIYKSRNKKAIEYIKKLQENDDIEIWRENGYWVYILHLLGGDDNE